MQSPTIHSPCATHFFSLAGFTKFDVSSDSDLSSAHPSSCDSVSGDFDISIDSSFGLPDKKQTTEVDVESSLPHLYERLGHIRRSAAFGGSGFGSEFTTSPATSYTTSPAFSASPALPASPAPSGTHISVSRAGSPLCVKGLCLEPGLETWVHHITMVDAFILDDEEKDENKENAAKPRLLKLGLSLPADHSVPEYLEELPARYRATPIPRALFAERAPHLGSPVYTPCHPRVVIEEPKTIDGYGSFKDFKLDETVFDAYRVPAFHFIPPSDFLDPAPVFDFEESNFSIDSIGYPDFDDSMFFESSSYSGRQYVADLNPELDEVYIPCSPVFTSFGTNLSPSS